MSNEHDARTVAVKPCVSCSAGLMEHDRFCRWCGVAQDDETRSNELFVAMPTTGFQTGTAKREAALCKRVSGPLISAVIDGMSNNGGPAQGSAIRAAIMALVSVPIWLMIVLLSPLDAYAAARTLVRQI